MKISVEPLRSVFRFLFLACLVLPITADGQSLITVNTASDEENFDDNCSLREAIVNANWGLVYPGCEAGSSTGVDRIVFDLPAEDGRTIILSDALQHISDTVVIDGFVGSDDGRTRTTLIGPDVPTYPCPPTDPEVGCRFPHRMLTIAPGADGTVVRGLRLISQDSEDWIIGIMTEGATHATIEENVLLGFGAGVWIEGGSSEITVRSNYIGVDPSGSVNAPVFVGIHVANSFDIDLGGSGVGNVVANITGYGMWALRSHDLRIRGNTLGTLADGTTVLPIEWEGILVEDCAQTVIGGVWNEGEGNVIGGARGGLTVTVSSEIDVIGNRIGVGGDGSTPIPNRWRGIRVNRSRQIRLLQNVVAHNQGPDGIEIVDDRDTRGFTPSQVEISGGSIHSNGGLGIDIVDPSQGQWNGVNPNDAGDADEGPNGLLNFPRLSSAFLHLSSATVTAALEGPADWVDVYATSACDESGYGEGGFFLARLVVGDPAFVAWSGPIPPSASGVTTTATYQGSTSEFSRCVMLDDPGDYTDLGGPEAKEAQRAIQNVAAGSDGTYWINENELDPESGHRVFSEYKSAIQSFMRLVELKGETGRWAKSMIQALYYQLKRVTEGSIRAGCSGDGCGYLHALLARAEELYWAGRPDLAIDRLRQAWEQSLLLVVASKAPDAPPSPAQGDVEQPSQFEVHPVYPNPFNPATKITYRLAEGADVRVEVFDILGRSVRLLVSEYQEAGDRGVVFDAGNLPTGPYLISVTAGPRTARQRAILLR